MYTKVFFLLFAAFIAYCYGSLATELTIDIENGSLMTSSSLLFKKSIRIADIRWINIRPTNRGFITVRAAGAWLSMYRKMPGAIDAMRSIAKSNPAIELKE